MIIKKIDLCNWSDVRYRHSLTFFFVLFNRKFRSRIEQYIAMLVQADKEQRPERLPSLQLKVRILNPVKMYGCLHI